MGGSMPSDRTAAEQERTREWHVLEELPELPLDGTGVSLEVAGRSIALFRTAEGLFALDDTCPHRGASLGMGIVLEGEVTCPWHGFHFRLRDGVSGDGLEECVEVFPVRQEAAGGFSVGIPKSL